MGTSAKPDYRYAMRCRMWDTEGLLLVDTTDFMVYQGVRKHLPSEYPLCVSMLPKYQYHLLKVYRSIQGLGSKLRNLVLGSPSYPKELLAS